MVRRITILVVVKLQQLLSILATNLELISGIKVHIIKPVSRIVVALVRIVDGIQNPIRTNQVHTEIQHRGRKLSRCGDPNVIPEVFVQTLLGSHATGLLDLLEPAVDPVKVVRQAFTHVSYNHLDAGEAVKDAVGDQTKNMSGDINGE